MRRTTGAKRSASAVTALALSLLFGLSVALIVPCAETRGLLKYLHGNKTYADSVCKNFMLGKTPTATKVVTSLKMAGETTITHRVTSTATFTFTQQVDVVKVVTSVIICSGAAMYPPTTIIPPLPMSHSAASDRALKGLGAEPPYGLSPGEGVPKLEERNVDSPDQFAKVLGEDVQSACSCLAVANKLFEATATKNATSIVSTMTQTYTVLCDTPVYLTTQNQATHVMVSWICAKTSAG